MVLQPRLRHRGSSLSSNSSASSDFDAGFNFLGQASATGGDRVSRAISIASTSCAEPHADDGNGGGYCSSDGSYIAAVAAASAAAAARSSSSSRHAREPAGSVLASAGLGSGGDGGIVLGGGGGGGARVPVAATRSPSPAAQRGLSKLRRHLAGPRANSPVITERARQMPRAGRVEDSLLQRREEYMARRDVRRRGHEMCELMTLRGPQICEKSRKLCEAAAGRRRSASVASGGGGGVGVGGSSSVGGGGEGDAFDRLYASAMQQHDRKTKRAEEAAAEADVCSSVEAYVAAAAAASARSAAASPSWRSASSSGAGGSQRRRQQQAASTDRFAAWQHARDAKVLSRQQAREDAEMASFSGTPRLNPLSLRIAENLERSSGGERLTQQQRTARMSEPRAASPAPAPPPPPPPPLHLRRQRRRSSSCGSAASRTRSTERLRVVQEAASPSTSGRPLHMQHLRSSSPAAAAAAAATAPSDPATGQKLFQPRVNTKANRRLLSASGGSGSAAAARSRSGSAGGGRGGSGASTVWEQLSERGAEKEGRMQRLQAQRAKEEEARQTGRPTLGAYTTLLADLKAQREGGGSRLSQETHHVKSKATLGCLQREELNNSFTPTVLEESQRLDERRHPASALRRRARSGSAGSRVALLATKHEEYTRRRERARHEQERDELEALQANRVDAGAVPRPASEIFRNNLNWDKRRQARLAQARQDLAEEEVSECTFRPNVDRAENLEPSSAGYSAAVSKRNEWVKAIYALRGGEPRGEPSRLSEADVGGTSGELDFFPQSIVQMP